MIATFVGGPADGMALQVRGTEVFIAVINGKPVEFPTWPDQRILQLADDTGWARYVVDGQITGEPARFIPA